MKMTFFCVGYWFVFFVFTKFKDSHIEAEKSDGYLAVSRDLYGEAREHVHVWLW